MNKKFKYTATFGANISLASNIDDGKLRISESSLDNLKPLLPKHVNLEQNIDLLGVAFDGAVINTFNKNGDGINSTTAKKIKDYFINKPVNIEHQRQKVVGHIVGSYFTKKDDGSLINLDDSLSSDQEDPFHLSLSAVIYKIVNQDFAKLVEDSAEEKDNPLYKSVSASWELGYNDYAIAVGTSNMLKDCDIVYRENNAELFNSLSNHLHGEGGSGETEEGKKVFRLIIGEVFPLGIGLTMNPAADVSGVAVYKKEDEAQSDWNEEEESNEKSFFEKNEEKISQNKTLTVINQNKPHYKSMENKEQIISILEDLLGEKLANKKFSEEAVATVTKVVNDAILEKNEQFLAEKEKAEKQSEVLAEAKKETDEKLAAVTEEFENLKSQFEQTQKELSEVRAEQAAALAASVFDSRMEVLDSTYDLEDSDREFLATELKDLDTSEEAFAAYSEKIAKIWNHKNKEVIAKQAELIEAKINEEVEKRISEMQVSSEASEEVETKVEESNASVEVEETSEQEAEEILDNVVEASEEEIVNNNEESAQVELSLKDKFEKAFSKENLTIKY